MCRFRIKAEARRNTGAREYGLAEAQGCHRHGIEARKRMKWIALEVMPFGSGSHKAMVEVGIVANQNCALATLTFHLRTDMAEHIAEHFLFGMRNTQRM